MKTLLLLALAGSLASLSRAEAPSALLTKFFGEQGADAAVPPSPPAVVVPIAAAASRPGGWQAIARPKNNSPRGPHVPVWTHRCYPTPEAAVEAAEASCRRENAGYQCSGEPYWATRCDR